MPDTGAPWNIPYVAASDLVKDWPTDNQQQAEAIADALDLAGIGIGTNTVLGSKTDSFSTTSTTWTAITGLSATITPTSATSKVLLLGMINYGPQSSQRVYVRLMRDSTEIAVGTSVGSREPVTAYTFGGGTNEEMESGAVAWLDSPATTSAVTYSYEIRTSGGTVGVNRTVTDTDAITHPRAASTIIAIEVTT